MFSIDEVESFSIELELPSFEEKKNVVEEFISKFPLSTMKFEKMQSILIKLKQTVNEMPVMILQGEGVSLYLARKDLSLNVNKVKSFGLTPGQEKVADIEPFSADMLKRISNDFNFVVAGIMGLLGLTSFEAELNLAVSKEIEKEVYFDTFVVPDFWSRLGDFREKHFSGFEIKFEKDCMGVNAECNIRLATDTKEEKGEKKKVMTAKETVQFVLKGPLDLSVVIKESLDGINVIHGNLTGDA